jgi:ADP-ribose pyrophosphatase YjhB (NUDIX family)
MTVWIQVSAMPFVGRKDQPAVATASDISWSGSAGTFNLRVAAVISRGEEVLLCTVDGLGYWFLPGGRVRFGEAGEAALARELAEELGHQFPAGKLALIAENIFDAQTLQHEIGLYYQLPWPSELAPDDLRGGTEPGHEFCWMPVRALGSVRFEPAGLIPVLQGLGNTVQHVVLSHPEP